MGQGGGSGEGAGEGVGGGVGSMLCDDLNGSVGRAVVCVVTMTVLVGVGMKKVVAEVQERRDKWSNTWRRVRRGCMGDDGTDTGWVGDGCVGLECVMSAGKDV